MTMPVLSTSRGVRWVGTVLLSLALLLILPAAPAHAHETREVGPFEVVVGWWEEPAFEGQPNGPEITIMRDGEPVLEDDVELEVELSFGEQAASYELEPAFGEDGNYNSVLVPTRAGTYEFHFTGTVQGEEIDEVFTSGPETFSDIEDPASIAFPVADPSTADLSERLERETVRLASDVEANSGSDTLARTLSIVALVGALAAIAIAGFGVVRKK
jgi:hypothetical protein